MVMSFLGMIGSFNLEKNARIGLGAGFLPFLTFVLMGFLALILLINTLRGRMAVGDKPVFPKKNLFRLISLVVVLAIYLILFDTLGYLFSTFLFFFLTILILQKSRLVYALFSAALFTFLLHSIFKLWLKSQLPAGLFGI